MAGGIEDYIPEDKVGRYNEILVELKNMVLLLQHDDKARKLYEELAEIMAGACKEIDLPQQLFAEMLIQQTRFPLINIFFINKLKKKKKKKGKTIYRRMLNLVFQGVDTDQVLRLKSPDDCLAAVMMLLRTSHKDVIKRINKLDISSDLKSQARFAHHEFRSTIRRLGQLSKKLKTALAAEVKEVNPPVVLNQARSKRRGCTLA